MNILKFFKKKQPTLTNQELSDLMILISLYLENPNLSPEAKHRYLGIKNKILNYLCREMQ